MFVLIILFFLILGVLSVVQKVKGQTPKVDEKRNAFSLANEAAEAFARVMLNEKGDVFLSLLKETDCAVVFPSVSEADYLELKDGRRGMASCRLEDSWGVSVFVVLKTKSINSERRQADLVFFFKNAEDLTNMLDDKAKLGKPVKFKEFNTNITKFSNETDVIVFGNKDSEINIESLNQASIEEGKKFMRKTYGRGTDITEWMKELTKYAPGELYSFNRSIKKFERGSK